MIKAKETFNGTYPFKPHFFKGRGFKMHYADEGKGEPILCLHGQPTWSYLYRNFIPPLSKTHRVIAPDMMGYGKSETPPKAEYTFENHVENLIALVKHLDLKNITIVCQDWGGPIAGAFTLRQPNRVKRICMMNTMMGYSPFVKDIPASTKVKLTDSSWFKWVLKTYKDGTYRHIMEKLGDHVHHNMKRLYFHNDEVVTKDWLNAYAAPFATKAETIAAVEFPLDAALGRIRDYVIAGVKTGNLEKLRAKPAMLAEGMLDRAMPPAMVMDDFRRLFPKGPIVELANAGHFCQEDAPETLVALIQQFIQMTE